MNHSVRSVGTDTSMDAGGDCRIGADTFMDIGGDNNADDISGHDYVYNIGTDTCMDISSSSFPEPATPPSLSQHSAACMQGLGRPTARRHGTVSGRAT